ncbi:hypothetical protein ACFYUL_33745 [Streptomyces sp. NPDC004311]|uniref:hypothetical protein n=1 Tax=Streptomyces sp. NPDC004311 TaxID=3364698 RepID=UPI00369A2569
MPPRLVVTSRRARVLAFRADRWAAKKAAAQAALAVAEWDYPLLDEHDFLTTVHGLVGAAVAAGGKRVSVHLADQDDKILVMALNHQTSEQDAAGAVPAEVAALRTVEACGAHTDHAWWALLDAQPRPKKAPGVARERRSRSKASLAASPRDARQKHTGAESAGRTRSPGAGRCLPVPQLRWQLSVPTRLGGRRIPH